MSRRKIRGFIKQPVERTLITPEKTERKVLTNPETNEVEIVKVVTPAVYKQGRAQGSTVAPKKGK